MLWDAFVSLDARCRQKHDVRVGWMPKLNLTNNATE